MENAPQTSELRRIATKELALFSGLLFIGLIIVPVLVYQVGQTVFGEYGGVGYGDFFGRLSSKIRSGDPSAWFLVFSPYMGWQCLRLMMLGWRASAARKSADDDH